MRVAMDVATALLKNNKEQFQDVLEILETGVSIILEADEVLHPYIDYGLRKLQKDQSVKIKFFPEIIEHDKLYAEREAAQARTREEEAQRNSQEHGMLTIIKKAIASRKDNMSPGELLAWLCTEEQGFSPILMEPEQNSVRNIEPKRVALLRDADFVVETTALVELRYMIKNFRNGVFLWLHDPRVELPVSLRQAFPVTIRLKPLDKDVMWERIITEAAQLKVQTAIGSEYFGTNQDNQENEQNRLFKEENAKLTLWQAAAHLNLYQFCELMKVWDQQYQNTMDPMQFLSQYAPGSRDQIEPVTLDRIGGYYKLKQKLYDCLLTPFSKWNTEKKSSKKNAYFRCITKGVCFEGSPGNGKTYLARWLATEMKAYIEVISAAEVLSKWVGEGERNIRELFARARLNSPSIIVFDEFDAIASTRQSDSPNQFENRIVNTLLTEIEGLKTEKSNELVIVIATTNRWENLDPGITRPGRIEEHILIENPTIEYLQDLENSASVLLAAGRKGLLEVMLYEYPEILRQSLDKRSLKDKLFKFFQGESYCDKTSQQLKFSCDSIRDIFKYIERHLLLRDSLPKADIESNILFWAKERSDQLIAVLKRRENAQIQKLSIGKTPINPPSGSGY